MAEATATAGKYSEKVQDVLDRISGFTLLELSELVDAFEDRFGVTAAVAPVALAAGGAPAAAAAQEEAVPSSYKVILKSFGDQKIQVIKAVRALTNLELKKAKDLVEKAPTDVKEGLSKEDADKWAKQLTEAGGQAEIKAE